MKCELDKHVWAVITATHVLVRKISYQAAQRRVNKEIDRKPSLAYEITIVSDATAQRLVENSKRQTIHSY